MAAPAGTTTTPSTSPVPTGPLTFEQRMKDCQDLAKMLPLLPKIMHNKGWKEGATLMERWFSLPASTNTEANPPSMISLAWALSYPRAQRVYNHIIANRMWMNKAAQAIIFNYLIKGKNRLPMTKGVSVPFGDSGYGRNFAPSKMLDFHKNFNIQTVEAGDGISAPLDDLLAALGDFHFHCAVEGTVKRLTDSPPHRYEIKIDKVGIYIKDTYDFNDSLWSISQPLGFWHCYSDEVSKKAIWFTYVNNDSFRKWRSGHTRGGDFLVFSNINILHRSNDIFIWS